MRLAVEVRLVAMVAVAAAAAALGAILWPAPEAPVYMLALVLATLSVPLVAICAWWAGRAIRRAEDRELLVPTVLGGPGPVSSEGGRRRAVWRPAGLRQAEAELARSQQRQGEVSLALIGLDGRQRDSADEEVRLLDLLDEAILPEIAPNDVLSAYGPNERLLVLSEVSVSGLRAGAARLCAAAEQRLGRPVRAAVATFPHDGRSLRQLLDGLERDLAARREDGRRLAAARKLLRAGLAGPP